MRSKPDRWEFPRDFHTSEEGCTSDIYSHAEGTTRVSQVKVEKEAGREVLENLLPPDTLHLKPAMTLVLQRSALGIISLIFL